MERYFLSSNIAQHTASLSPVTSRDERVAGKNPDPIISSDQRNYHVCHFLRWNQEMHQIEKRNQLECTLFDEAFLCPDGLFLVHTSFYSRIGRLNFMNKNSTRPLLPAVGGCVY